MATLLESLQDCTYDLQNKRDLSGDFAKKLISYRDRIISDYLKFNTDLNKSIAAVSLRDNLNDDKIQRIIEEVNNQVYLIKYDKLKSSYEREVDFDIASLSKIKKIMTGNKDVIDHTNNDESPSDSSKNEKRAFVTEKMPDEYFEKVASSGSDFFSGKISHALGDLSTNNKKTKERFYLEKIADSIKDKQLELEKIAKDIAYVSGEIGESLVGLNVMNVDTDSVISAIVKKANLNESEFSLIKEATDKKLSLKKEANEIPNFVEIPLNVNLEKQPDEKFNIGKFSLNKKAGYQSEIRIPKLLLNSNRVIGDLSDLIKLASELKDNSDLLYKKNNEYIEIRNKCAEVNIDESILDRGLIHAIELEKKAGLIDDSINKLKSIAGNNSIKNSTNEVISAKPNLGMELNSVKNRTEKIVNEPKNDVDMNKVFNKATRKSQKRIGIQGFGNNFTSNPIPSLNNGN